MRHEELLDQLWAPVFLRAILLLAPASVRQRASGKASTELQIVEASPAVRAPSLILPQPRAEELLRPEFWAGELERAAGRGQALIAGDVP